ncbi:type II restriction endonuclease [Mycoplasma feriruminatoris]|uniref:type II restriction enzyme n=1 Tax=Mycoplasma feriruminatoris TaxID=1179777 RepID=UPI00241EC554|nr:hypothetical protein [Mycoplasma feriruminatoris]WFQ95977.1 type II restriction endonuclease [Mycoplasma feriruminatoris]
MDSFTNNAWEKLFKDLNVLEEIKQHGTFIISAEQIKKYREPRLMAKFDSYDNLPQILKTII